VIHRKKKRILLCLTALCTALLCSGCLLKSADELYALPQQSDAYYDLQQVVDEVVSGTITYCAPMEGENRQPLQLEDLDGDGSNEAIVFARDEGEKPLKILIFDRVDEEYQLISKIEGDGNTFDSVDYLQVDGSPGMEIVVGRGISDQVVKSLSVYTFQGNSTVELMSANYTVYTSADLDIDGRKDLFLIRFESEAQTATVELFRYRDGVMVRDPEQRLSQGVVNVKRIISGYTDLDVPAVFVAGALDESLIRTDVFALRDGVLQNIAASQEEGVSVRNYYVYGTDIDNDGLIELPDVQTLPDLTDAEDTTAFRLIHWYNLDLAGSKHFKRLTYHDYYYGYYLDLPESWNGRVTIRRDSTVEEGVAFIFSWWNGSNLPSEELFTIYVLSGDHRNELAEQDGRFLLADKNDVTYAASLGDSSKADGLTESIFKLWFHFIHLDWNSGET